MNKLFLILLFISFNSFAQYQEAYITRTFGTNSVFPRQFPSMTIRKMSDKEYWLFDSLNTNTIFHRQFPSYIIRKQNFNSQQSWAVYRTTSTNSVFPRQFPDRYISDFYGVDSEQTMTKQSIFNKIKSAPMNYMEKNYNGSEDIKINNSYTYSRTLRKDNKPAYSGD